MYPKTDEGAAQAQQPPATGVPMSGAYYQAPAAFAVQAPVPVAAAAWSTGLFDCFDDCGNCIVTCLCPCITFGQIAEIVDQGSPSCACHGALYMLIKVFTGFQCIYSCVYRTKMREQYGMQESPCADCCVHCCCERCALCQMYRELTNRGFDVSQGWQANMEIQGRTAATVPPPMHAGMTR